MVLLETHPSYPLQLFHDGTNNEYPLWIAGEPLGVAMTVQEAYRMMSLAGTLLKWERGRYGNTDPVEVSHALKQCKDDFDSGGVSQKGIARLVACFAE